MVKKIKSKFKYAEVNALAKNKELFNTLISHYENPCLDFLFNHQHPFFLISLARERTNTKELEPAFIFTFLHKRLNQPIIDIVFENINPGKATLIFSVHFHANIRNSYLLILQKIKNYFSSFDFNKRQKLIEAGGILNESPQFSLSLSRVAHDDFYHWAELIEQRTHMYLPITYGCLKDHLVNGQKMAQKFLTL
ncbi:hypothetical protein [uncultured Duncaniella sp.]|uniref:hypothetical protein n=1 Tax=uncultured Duncaniella sp. TaxID=2768039 RepID=UPI0026321830|nr:hypothetical protein [uncultured Duncaniella sp.]